MVEHALKTLHEKGPTSLEQFEFVQGIKGSVDLVHDTNKNMRVKRIH